MKRFLSLVLLCFCSAVKAEELFNFGFEDFPEQLVPAIKPIDSEGFAESAPSIVITETQRPRLFNFFQRWRERRAGGLFAFGQYGSLSERIFAKRQLRIQGRITAAQNFAATGINTRMRGLSMFFPRSWFGFRL